MILSRNVKTGAAGRSSEGIALRSSDLTRDSACVLCLGERSVDSFVIPLPMSIQRHKDCRGSDMFRYLYGFAHVFLIVNCSAAWAQSNAPVVLGDYYEDKATINVAGTTQAIFKFAAIPSGKFLTITDVGCIFSHTSLYLKLYLALGSKYGATDNVRFHPLRAEGQSYMPNSPQSGSNFNVPANFKFGSSLFPSLVIPLTDKGSVVGTCFIRGKLSTT